MEKRDLPMKTTPYIWDIPLCYLGKDSLSRKGVSEGILLVLSLVSLGATYFNISVCLW